MEMQIVLVNVSGDAAKGEPDKSYFSLLAPEVLFEHGLFPQAIIGEYKGPTEGDLLAPEHFVANTVFKDFLHEVLASLSTAPEIIAEAKRVGHGLVVVIDRRVPDLNAAIAPADIIGAFAVREGTAAEYLRNPNHRLLNEFGFFKLEPYSQAALLNELERLRGKSGNA